ncbi:right-handed parallel beta-helix repeat-containing protein [Cellulomonas sp. 179-A 4D5 NHS]|uniref:hypothetical protein n=1 Tax=Cellulomonas sp. 179-A 4D5 NHS TaxID=3142378 RepID=UPI0039A29875
MTGRNATGAPTQRSRARRLALTSVGALIMTLVPWSASQATAPAAALPADPGASAATTPMVSAAAATTTAPTIEELVLAPGTSRTVTLPAAPANATSVTLKLRGRWSWKPTRISVCAGQTATTSCKGTAALTTPTQRAKTATVTVALPASAKNRVTLYNADASVRVRAEVQSYTTPPPPPAPAPAPAPTTAPVQPKPAPSATAPAPAPAPTSGSGSGSGSGGFAGPGSTGVPAGTALATHNGDLVITQPGTVIDSLDIHGLVKVKADNVTIKRSIIRGRPLTGSMGLITNDLGKYRFTLEDSELVAADASPHVSGIIGHNFEVRRTEIAKVIDSVHITGSDVLVEGSWLHDNLFYAQDPNHNGGPSHADSVQIQGGSNITFRGNTIEGAESSAFQTTQDRAAVSGVTVTNNKIDGGACSVNVAYGSKYGPIQGFTVSNNVFGTSQRHARCAIIAPSSNTIANTNNTWVDGSPVQLSRG